MAVKPTFTPQSFEQALRQRMAQLALVIISRLILIGEQFVTYARQNGDYNDITGNLRASIGFVVLHNGEVKGYGGFEGEAEGARRGKAFLDSLVNDFQTGYALICVAGMEYAAKVESTGRDVITGAGIMAEKQLKEAIKSISQKR